jgi:hypothetical protein
MYRTQNRLAGRSLHKIERMDVMGIPRPSVWILLIQKWTGFDEILYLAIYNNGCTDKCLWTQMQTDQIKSR